MRGLVCIFMYLILQTCMTPVFAVAPPSATAVPIPTPRPVNHENYYYFYTRPEGHAAFYDARTKLHSKNLPGDTLVRTKLNPQEIISNDRLILIETVPKTTAEPILVGFISIDLLGREITHLPTPLDEDTIRNAEVIIGQIRLEQMEREQIEARKRQEAAMTLDDALQEFHDTACSQGATRTELALKAKWAKYIDKHMLSERGKILATGARKLDLVARTILYETQREENIAGQGLHPQTIPCQWDVIALSITNRAYTEHARRRAGYGAKFLGDIEGVATDTQYNVWMDGKVAANQDILACYLNKNYKSTRTTNLYKGIAGQIRETLGIRPTGQFFAPNVERRFQAVGASSPRLKEFTHYFHPGGMNRCHVNRNSSPIVKHGYIRVITVNPTSRLYELEIFPIINGNITGKDLKNIRVVKKPSRHSSAYPLDIRSDNEWDFDLFIYENKRWHQVSSDTVFKGDAALVLNMRYEESAPDPFHRTCLPDGLPPQCHEGSSLSANELGARGIEVPITWYQKPHVDEILSGLIEMGFNNPSYNINLPRGYSFGNGRPIAIRCISPNLKVNNSFPSIGGTCDKNIQLASEVAH